MNLLHPLNVISPAATDQFGGKACSLAALSAAGMPVPETAVLSCDTYQQFVMQTGLIETIRFELGRKPLEEMRWEELWDSALRLRNHFLSVPWLQQTEKGIVDELAAIFADRPVAVRSSAPGEDSATRSFAGLHDSVLGVTGNGLLQAIRRVWASLWSDRALLYRRELGLDPLQSRMAVVLMELQPASTAGILFSRSPASPGQGVIEAVHGQGQGLVDGSVTPDRWLLERDTDRLIEHQPPAKRLRSRLQEGLIIPTELPELEDRPPLDQDQVSKLWQIGSRLETLFGKPIDCEWCLVADQIQLLQVRPITSPQTDPDDKRPWYLSLHPSRSTLERLRATIEQERLPAMDKEASELAEDNLERQTAIELVAEIEKRQQALERWEEIYQREYIPMAHGIRLFGEVYNDRIKPRDPFEFTRLLAGHGLRALQRNQALQQLAEHVRNDPAVAESLRRRGRPPDDSQLEQSWQQFLVEYGDPAWFAGENALAALVQAFAEAPGRSDLAADAGDELEQLFLQSFPAGQQSDALALLELGRAAYRLRDDDNIAFGRFLSELKRVCRVAQDRLADPLIPGRARQLLEAALAGTTEIGLRGQPALKPEPGPLAARQLVGQPAGPGSATGPARVILQQQDLNAFQHGEILVCDAVDPTMTFVAPLAAAVVERRGGMLIHGAIIAREYGLPCVTGVPNVTELIHTGQQLTVDGWLGLVILETEKET